MSGARAAAHGASTAQASVMRANSAASGMPGTAMSASTPARSRSAVTSSRRRGSRSASPPSSGPPTMAGRKVTAYDAADSSGEPVRL